MFVRLMCWLCSSTLQFLNVISFVMLGAFSFVSGQLEYRKVLMLSFVACCENVLDIAAQKF